MTTTQSTFAPVTLANAMQCRVAIVRGVTGALVAVPVFAVPAGFRILAVVRPST